MTMAIDSILLELRQRLDELQIGMSIMSDRLDRAIINRCELEADMRALRRETAASLSTIRKEMQDTVDAIGDALAYDETEKVLGLTCDLSQSLRDIDDVIGRVVRV